MAEITASAVKSLREKTGAGMMDAKNALVENSGDMEAAVDWLRKKGLAKAALFSRFRNSFLRLALGADEQHPSAPRYDIANGSQGRIHHRHGLLKIENMYAVTNAEDIRLHFRVPAAGVVTKVNACFKQLAHGDIGHSHIFSSFSGCDLCGKDIP